MTTILPPHDWLVDADVQALMRAFHEAGEEIRFVGGCVRDGWLDIPVQDIDMATTALPDKTQAILADAGIKSIPTGLVHGTITAVLATGKPIEITTLREDVACDGRHAEVIFTRDWEKDALRRDFTLNALSADSMGRVFDYTHGVQDAEAGQVLFIGHAADRIAEDRLRALRFFRFWSRYGKGAADEAALEACAAAGPELEQLSGERIRQEIARLMVTRRVVEAWQLMAARSIGECLIGASVHTSWLAALVALPTDTDDWALRLAVLLRQSRAKGEAIAGRWRFSKQESRVLTMLMGHTLWDGGEDIWALRREIRSYGRDAMRRVLLMSWAVQDVSAQADMQNYQRLLQECEGWELPVFPVSGGDVMKAGIAQGRAVGEALARLERIWEEGHYQLDRDALLNRLDHV